MPPITIMIKPVSSLCNMRCKYCFYSDVAKHRSQEFMGKMSFDTLETIVRRALRYAEDSAFFAFQGGEPTLIGAEFYERLLKYEQIYNSHNVQIYNSIQTNGYELNEDMLEVLKKGHFLVGVSFDGVTELHDSLRVNVRNEGTAQKVEHTLLRLQEKNIEFNILCVVNQHVACRPEAVFRALSKYKYIQYIPCLDSFDGKKQSWSLEESSYASFLKTSFDLYFKSFESGQFVSIRNFDNYINILLGNPPESCGMCGRCALYWLIESDGSVYPCDFYVLDQWRLGNINKKSFFQMSKSLVQEQFIQDSLHIDDKCKTCTWFSLCRGGCRRDREPFSDGKPILNKHCESYSSFFEYAYPRMVEMAQIIRSNSVFKHYK